MCIGWIEAAYLVGQSDFSGWSYSLQGYRTTHHWRWSHLKQLSCNVAIKMAISIQLKYLSHHQNIYHLKTSKILKLMVKTIRAYHRPQVNYSAY